MDTRATSKYLPISPQKLRLVCDVVRGMEPYDALDTLSFMPQKGAEFVLKTERGAVPLSAAEAEAAGWILGRPDVVVGAVLRARGTDRFAGAVSHALAPAVEGFGVARVGHRVGGHAEAFAGVMG